MKTETVPIESISPDPANARSHGERNLEAIRDSLRAFGQQKPIVVDGRGIVIAGNGTLEAAKRLGWTEIAIVRTELDPGQAKAFGIADNRTGELADWNDEVLRSLLDTMDDEMLKVLAFDPKEIDALVPSAATSLENDEIPEAVDPVTKPGDLITLGSHRLLCGDSTKREDVDRLMDGEKAGMIFTDPPYALFGNSTGCNGVTDDKMVRPFFRDVLGQCQRVVQTCGHVYVCCDWHSAMTIEAVSREAELIAKNLIVWDKGDGGVGGMYQHCHELIWFFSNTPARTTTTKKTRGDRTVNGVPNIWRFARVPFSTREHNAAKPVEMIEVPIGASSDPGDIVLDLFLGSGSTLVAAERTDRRCFGMEIDPAYCDVIVKRWENLTGEEATR
jgi:DNA modification methylase